MASLTDLFDKNVVKQQKENVSKDESFDIIAEAKMNNDSDAMCIPHVGLDHPKYGEYSKDLKKVKVSSPILYKKIMGWD